MRGIHGRRASRGRAGASMPFENKHTCVATRHSYYEPKPLVDQDALLLACLPRPLHLQSSSSGDGHRRNYKYGANRLPFDQNSTPLMCVLV